MIVKQALLRFSSVPVIEKSLDAGMLRQNAIADNLANVTTPRYQRIEVRFEDALREVVDRKKLRGTRTDDAHLPVGRRDITEIRPEAFRVKDNPANPGEINNVDVDLEMAKLAENQIHFNYGIKFMTNQLNSLTACIKGNAKMNS